MASIAATGNNVDQIHLESTLVVSSIVGIPLVPGCQLPTETLIQIFLETLSLVISDKINNRPTYCRHPTLAIASVCHRWRDIALGTPDLWGYIPVNRLKTHGYAEKVNAITKAICTRAMHTKELILDFTYAFNEESTQNHAAYSTIKDFIFALEAVFGAHNAPATDITIYWPCRENPTVHLGNIAHWRLNYRLYNLMPYFSPEKPNQVHSITLHLRKMPDFGSIFILLKQCPNLVHFELDFPYATYSGVPYYPASFPVNPHLQSFSTRLSMIPVFFHARRSVSKGVSSLQITLDRFPWRMTPEDWDLTIDSSGLSRSVQRLELEVAPYISMTKEKIHKLLMKFTSVATLSLHGHSMGIVLDTLIELQTLLPALRRLEMSYMTVDPIKMASLLDSCHRVNVRELVFDLCSNITRENCEEMKGKVDRLIIY